MRQDNDMIGHTSAIYTENKTKLSQQIELGVVYDEKKIEQRCDRSYKYDLRHKGNWTIMTDRIESGMWWKLEKIMN